jgi:hypothetical protein
MVVIMKTTYSYKFTHHTNLVTTDYKFIVYRAHCFDIYDVISEFDGLEAYKHYQAVQNTTPEQLQRYLDVIAREDYNKKCIELVAKRAEAKAMRAKTRVAFIWMKYTHNVKTNTHNMQKEHHSIPLPDESH